MGLYLKGNKGIFTLGLVGFGESLRLDVYVQSVLTRKPPGSTYRASFTLDRWVIWPLKEILTPKIRDQCKEKKKELETMIIQRAEENIYSSYREEAFVHR